METRFQKLTTILRLCGAGMLLAAAGTFMVQQWAGAGDVFRYLGLLAMTAAVPVLAYFCGISLREGKTARLLMSVLLALAPMHACVLGGFVFSQFGPEHMAKAAAIQWTAPSPMVAIVLAVGALVALTPMMWMAFRTLARPNAAMLTASAVGLNALMLLPTRDPDHVGILLLPMAAIAVYSFVRAELSTWDGRLAVGFLMAPIVLLLGRQLCFYSVTNVLIGGGAALVAAMTFYLGRRFDSSAALERFTVLPAALSVGAFLTEAADVWGLDPAQWQLAFALCAGGAFALLAARSERSRAFFGWAAACVAAICTGIGLLGGGPWAGLQALVLGLGLLSYGFLREHRGALYTGIALGIGGLAAQVEFAIRVFDISGWLALAVLGALVLVITAFVERRAAAMRAGVLGSDPILNKP